MGTNILNNLTLFRRREYVIIPKFQFKYLIIIAGLIFIILLATTHVINVTIRTTPILENLTEIEVVDITLLCLKQYFLYLAYLLLLL